MTPIYRTKDQEHAFRQIEDVHNYSKLNRNDSSMDDNCQNASELTLSSNSSNQDEDDDEEDDENRYEKEMVFKKKEKGELENENTNATRSSLLATPNQEKYKNLKLTEPHGPFMENERQTSPPEHHARRPMNAFLIFCKRHRCIVKDKYKNYENRAITKILGEWWASLDQNDKKCYVNLAKQNKDAFFSANPNFKWYKLPAPSLRSLNTRPGNVEREDDQCELDIPSRNSSSFKDIPPCGTPTNEVKNVSYFRLADETQMGELNNLMYANSTSGSKNKTVQKPLCAESLFITTGCKLKSSTTNELALNSKRLHSDNSSSNSDDECTPKKLVRSCKGKKYQEFINSGQITAVHSKNPISSRCADNNPFVLMRFDDSNKVTGSLRNDLFLPKADESPWVMSHYKDSDEFNKEQYGFVSFDLEEKINKLPAQSLEIYLQRKKTTKRKKKINSKKHSSILQPMIKEELLKETSQCLLDHKQKTALKVKELMVGSQKRKARKESITRRDISSIQNDVQVLLNNNYSLATSAIEVGRDSSSQLFSVNNQDPTSDLLILAEAAAHRTETA